MKSLGHQIANDIPYGGIYRNNGIQEEYNEEDFEGFFQNEDNNVNPVTININSADTD